MLCVDSTGRPDSHLLLHKHIENYCGDLVLFKSVKIKQISSSQESIWNNSFLVTMNCNFFYTVCMNSFKSLLPLCVLKDNGCGVVWCGMEQMENR